MTLFSTRMCCLLTGLALTACFPALAAETPAPAPEVPLQEESPAPATNPADKSLDQLEEVIVYATSGQVIAGLRAESELGEAAIAAYGANTVGDLLAQVAPNVDNTEQGPVILINGKPANGIRSVNDLPPEAIAKLQVLPPQAAGAIGESPTRRVINVVLKQQFSQGTGNLTARGATAGQGYGGNTNFSVLKLVNNNIRNISANASTNRPLLESQRGILTQSTAVPYDLTGNVLSWPITGGEIDPGLSTAAGTPVTVAGVPRLASPTLGNFVPNANIANVSDMGRYRSLVADQFNYGVNGNISRTLPKNISLSVNANLDHSQSRRLNGATSTLLHLPASSPFTPFSRDVNIARYLGGPLVQKSESTNANVSANLSMQLGKWRLMSETNFSWNTSITDSERRADIAALQAAVNAGTVNPFDVLPADLLDDVLSDHARARGQSASARLQLSGQPFALPAGKANLNITAQWQEAGQHSRTVGTNNVSTDNKRQDRILNLNLQLPLLGSPQSQGFGMGGEIGGNIRDVTATGPLYTFGYGLNWRYANRINMRVGFNREKVSPSPSALSDPIVTVDDYRTYDFIRQETVLVRYITGGNPDLRTENRNVINISGQTRPFKAVDFTLNAQYTRTMYHDPMQSLPPPSETVQLAFPDRFRRDAMGRLFEIDARMVNFDHTQNEQFRWGGNFRRAFGVPKGPTPANSAVQIVSAAGGSLPPGILIDTLSGAGWQLNANFTHQWQVAYKRVMRPGTPEVDLLSGGAGFGSGQSRHRVQSTIGLAHNGTGMQLNANWTSHSFLIQGTSTAPNRIDFEPTLRFDLQAFTNLGPLYPNYKPLQGVRVSLAVENVLDYKQKVTDQNGLTPLRYQPYLQNPLGRMLSLSFRKAFSGT